MDLITQIENLFSDYFYSQKRDNTLPNLPEIGDNSLFSSWYIANFWGIGSILFDEVMPWTIYSDLDDLGLKIYDGDWYSFDYGLLQNGDILIFSTDRDFGNMDPTAYWSCIYWDETTVLNFNTLEGFGSSSLYDYVWPPGPFNFDYVAVFSFYDKDNTPISAWDSVPDGWQDDFSG